MSGWASNVSLTLRQVRYQLLTFVRTPIALFFTLIFPLMFFLLVNTVFGDGEIEADGGTWTVAQFYTGGIAAFAAVSATFTNLANMVPIRRDEGVMKRWRGTPLPSGVYIAGFVGSAFVLALVGVVLMLTVGALFYGVEIEAAKLPAALVTFVVGVTTWAALGLALAGLVPTASSAAAAANAILLPLAFISDTFIQSDDGLGVLSDIAAFFPLKPFANAFQDVFNPLVEAPAFNWSALAVMAAWGAVGVVVAVRFFRWEPHPAGSNRRARRARQAST
jgi:ABC-2 type transport system permease protein